MSSTVINYVQPITQPLKGLYNSFTQLASQHRDMDDRLRSHKDDLLSTAAFTFQGGGAGAFANLVDYFLDTSEKHMQAFDDASNAVRICHSTITISSNNADAAGLNEGLTNQVLSQVSHNDIIQRGSDPIQAVISDMQLTLNDMTGKAGDMFTSLLHLHFGTAFDDLLQAGGDVKQLAGDIWNLEHSELLVLLDAIGAIAVAGIDQAELFPQNERERHAVLEQGRSRLEQRGWLQAGQLHPGLFTLARIIARPQIALIVVHNEATVGPQLFAFYLAEEGIIERTLLQTKIHRLAVLDNISTVLALTTRLLSLPERTSDTASLEIEQETFFKANNLALQGQHQAALKLFQFSGAAPATIEALVATLEHLNFKGEVAILKCANQTVTDAREVAVMRDRTTAWYATQITPGQPRLRIESADAPIVQSLLSRYLVDLAQTAG